MALATLGVMPVIQASVIVPVPPAVAFWVSQTMAPIRYRWDPFIRQQFLLGGADRPAKGVRTHTQSKHRITMISEYVSFAPPRNVGMKMVSGPWFFERFGGGWRFEAGPATDTTTSDSTVAIWRYNFSTRPKLLSPLADPIGRWMLQRDINRRIAGYARGCLDPQVLAAAKLLADSA